MQIKRSKIFLPPFFRLLTYTNPNTLMDAKQQALTLSFYFHFLDLSFFITFILLNKIIITVRKHTAPANFKFHDPQYFLMRYEPVRDILQRPWVFFDCFFTHFFSLKMVRYMAQHVCFPAHGLVIHFLCLEAITNTSQEACFIFNNLITHLGCL